MKISTLATVLAFVAAFVASGVAALPIPPRKITPVPPDPNPAPSPEFQWYPTPDSSPWDPNGNGSSPLPAPTPPPPHLLRVPTSNLTPLIYAQLDLMGFNPSQLGPYPNEDEMQSMIDSVGGGIATDGIYSFASRRIHFHLAEQGFPIDEEDEEEIHQRLVHIHDGSIQDTIKEFKEVESADVGADMDPEEGSDYAVNVYDESSSGEDSESVCRVDDEDDDDEDDDDVNDLSFEFGDIGIGIDKGDISPGARKYISYHLYMMYALLTI